MKQHLFVLALSAAGLSNAASPGDKTEQAFISDAKELCEHKATKRGVLDDSRYRYCIRSHKKAYGRIVDMNAQHTDNFYTAIAYPFCYEKWTKRGLSRTDMIAYCLKSEVEAYKDIVYYAQQIGADKVFAVVDRALLNYGSLVMAAYEVRKQLNPPP